MTVAVRPITASGYAPHLLHAHDRAWPETNCYVDLWIELLNGLGLEPRASLPFVFNTDFEGDHFTFFKQSHEDLWRLHGLTVQEQPIWRHLTEHIEEQLALQRPILVELDSYYLPDTRGLAYRAEHVKTTVGAFTFDRATRRLGYFHNRGYYELDGEDFEGVFRYAPAFAKNVDVLPPYVEVVKQEPARALQGQALADASFALLRDHIARRPKTNPITAFRPRLERDVTWLLTEPMATYHLYVFNTFRQLGASFELGKSYLEWLSQNGHGGWDEAIAGCTAISETSKSVLMVLARAVSRKKLPDLKATTETLEGAWERVLGSADRACRVKQC